MVGSCKHLEESEAQIAIWKESLFAVEFFLLHSSPVYYGLGVPRGDNSGVVTIPGFLTTDQYLGHLYTWLGMIGYRPYKSGIGLNADCPNLLIQDHISKTVDTAIEETGGPVHLIGHSLGGVIARVIAAQRPQDIASVITIASPFRGVVAHPKVLRAAGAVRKFVMKNRGANVSRDCLTARCSCEFGEGLRSGVPRSVLQTAIYTCNDGVVDWRYCKTGLREIDFEVPGTHVGLVVNATVYSIIADRLAETSRANRGHVYSAAGT